MVGSMRGNEFMDFNQGLGEGFGGDFEGFKGLGG